MYLHIRVCTKMGEKIISEKTGLYTNKQGYNVPYNKDLYTI